MKKIIYGLLLFYGLSNLNAQNFEYAATGINYSPGDYGLSIKGITWFKGWGIGGENTISYRTIKRPKNQDGLNISLIFYPLVLPLNNKGLAVEIGAGVFYQVSFLSAANNIGMETHLGLDYKHQYLPINISLGFNPRIIFESEVDEVVDKKNKLSFRFPYIAFRIQAWGEYRGEVIKGAKSGKLKESKIF